MSEGESVSPRAPGDNSLPGTIHLLECYTLKDTLAGNLLVTLLRTLNDDLTLLKMKISGKERATRSLNGLDAQK